ncbi:CPBP family intramembrane glutamic endopeptidase [uncultured Winogradskyella sp.]|uniref:CPBP family intramembrane glutamic endopeptidase n=1 Tax=uncultured Winogradskyella sp. TaxID=395353 RepID=UPI003514C970
MSIVNNRFRKTSYLGLFIVLVLTTIFWFPSVYKSVLSDDFEVRNYQMQCVDWLVVLMILCLIKFGERSKFKSLNIKKPTLEYLGIGLGLGGFSMLYILVHRIVLNQLGITTSFEQQIENPNLGLVGPEFVFTYGILSLITAGIAEEIIYRGYATERLMKLKGSYWIAFIVPLIAFVLMHYRTGIDHLFIVLAVGSLMQFYYLKFRNLTINIIGHLFIDLMAYTAILYKTFN